MQNSEKQPSPFSSEPLNFSFGIQQPTPSSTVHQQTTPSSTVHQQTIYTSPSQGHYQLPYNLPLSTVVTVLVQSGNSPAQPNIQRVRNLATVYSHAFQASRPAKRQLEVSAFSTQIRQSVKRQLEVSAFSTQIRQSAKRQLEVSAFSTQIRQSAKRQLEVSPVWMKQPLSEPRKRTFGVSQTLKLTGSKRAVHWSQVSFSALTNKAQKPQKTLSKSLLVFGNAKAASQNSQFAAFHLLVSFNRSMAVDPDSLVALCKCLTLSPESEFVERKASDCQMPSFRFERLAATIRRFRSVWGRKEAVFGALSARQLLSAELVAKFRVEVERTGLGLWAVVPGEPREVFLALVVEDSVVFGLPAANPDYRDLVAVLTRITPSHRLALGPLDSAAPTDLPEAAAFSVQKVLPEKERCEARVGRTHVPKAAAVTLFGKGSLSGFFSKTPVVGGQKSEPLAVVFRTADLYAEFARSHSVKLKSGFSFSSAGVEKFLQEKFPVRHSKLKREVEAQRQRIEAKTDKTDVKVFEERLNFLKTASIVNTMAALCPGLLAQVKKTAAQRGPEFQQLLEEALANKDKEMARTELAELEGVFQNVLLDSDRQAVQRYARQKQLSEAAVAQMVEKPRKACLQDLMKAVNQPSSQPNLDGRRKSINKFVSLEDIEKDLKALKAEAPGGDSQSDAYLVWDSLARRMDDNLVKQKALENLKREFKETAVKRAIKDLCREELQRLLESHNDLEPVLVTSLKQGKPERGKSVGEWEVGYELVCQAAGGSELEVYGLEQSRRRPSDLSPNDPGAVLPVGEKFFHRVHVREGTSLLKVVHLGGGLQVVALNADNGRSELVLHSRASYNMRHCLAMEGLLTAVDGSCVKDSLVAAVSRPGEPPSLCFLSVDGGQRIVQESEVRLSDPDPVVDLAVGDSGDVCWLAGSKLMRMDPKSLKSELLESFEGPKRLLWTGREEWLLVVAGSGKQAQTVPFSLANRERLSPLELGGEVEAEGAVLATVGDQTQLLSLAKGKLQSHLLTFSRSRTSYQLASTETPSPTPLVQPTDYCRPVRPTSGHFDCQPLDFVVRELVCLSGLRVCRFEGNELVLLSNGTKVDVGDVTGTYDLEERLHFGHFSNVFSHWTKEVKVVARAVPASEDACRMTAASDNNTLCVALAFDCRDELGGTPQTRQLISTLMAALSDLSLFESEKAVLAIADGSQMLKGSDKTFKGVLAVQSARGAVFEALAERVEREGAGNVVSALFQGGVVAAGREEAEGRVLGRRAARFKTGAEFEAFLKMILSRIALQDFSSLRDSELEHRLKWLASNLDHCLKFGTIDTHSDDGEAKALRSLDNWSEVVGEASAEFGYKDSEVSLGGSKLAPVELFESLCARSQTDSREWDSRYRAFVAKTTDFREQRVREWLKLNTRRFGKRDRLDRFELDASRAIALFRASLAVCDRKCDDCFALCTYFERHNGRHDCGAKSHVCAASCSFCSDRECSLGYGHADKHLCDAFIHKCRQKCEIDGCGQLCRAAEGHADDHRCGSESHECLQQCSVPSCRKSCKVPLETSHSLHLCQDGQCPAKCSFSDCSLRCAAQDHSHLANGSGGGQSGLEGHLCGSDHPCPESCQSPGNCRVTVERILNSETFEGAREAFSYHKYHRSVGVKEQCCRVVPGGQLRHDGDHVHADTDFDVHTCTDRCPTCASFCDLPVGHEGPHATNHKNMESCRLVSDQRLIEVGEHKYVAGESSAAEMCHTFCQRLGRGHVHLVKCGRTAADCPSRADGRRVHETREYGPDFKVSKDELTHDAYWETINFEDPSSESDKALFRKCPFFCGSEEHGGERNYCQLDMWHRPALSLAEVGRPRGCLSADGHYFLCEHKHQAKYHFVLCLDDSGSMNGKPWEVLMEAVRMFAQSRLSNRGDRLTVIQFNENPIVMCESIPFDHFDVDKHLKFRAGGTSFGNAILYAQTVIKAHIGDGLQPVFVFMSDGKSNSGEAEIRGLAEEFGQKGLRIFTLAFDSSSSAGAGPSDTGKRADKSLRKLATASGGTHLSSISGLELKDLFMEISASFRTTIGVMAPI